MFEVGGSLRLFFKLGTDRCNASRNGGMKNLQPLADRDIHLSLNHVKPTKDPYALTLKASNP